MKIPWWGKIIAKLILSRLRVNYKLWQQLRLFRHGSMDNSDYAINVFNGRIERLSLTDHLREKLILELGPGDSIATAIIAATYEAKAILIDTGKFASDDCEFYQRLVNNLSDRGLIPPKVINFKSLDEILMACDAKYLTNGLESLRSLPDNSIDIIFSQAVLEHVRKAEFLDTLLECRRVLKPTGLCSHRIDLRDHLGGGLNNLRFSERLWESKFFSQSGFYTNRIRFSEMINLFEQAGYEVEIDELDRWPKLPIERKHLSSEFRDLSDEELNISGFSVTLKPI